jgi:superfamily I DNA/RNA helicase
MTDSAAILSTLNPAQQQAVTVDPGPTLVLAGPGAGRRAC